MCTTNQASKRHRHPIAHYSSFTTVKTSEHQHVPLTDERTKKFSSLTQSCPTLQPHGLRPHGLQHARPPCPSPTPRLHPNSCPSSWWCHLTISSSVILFSSCPQSLQALVFSNESTLHMRWPSTGVSALASFLPKKSQGWSPSLNWLTLRSAFQFSWVDCSMPGFSVHHQLLELAQTHVRWVGDAIQPSHPLSFTSPAFNLSQHQGLFQWVNSSYQVAKVLEFQL